MSGNKTATLGQSFKALQDNRMAEQVLGVRQELQAFGKTAKLVCWCCG
jgi:hypothetical protein